MKKLMEIMAEELSSAFEKAGHNSHNSSSKESCPPSGLTRHTSTPLPSVSISLYLPPSLSSVYVRLSLHLSLS